MQKIVQYKVLDKVFADEKSAQKYEAEQIDKLRKFDNYDEIWMLDYLSDRILNSYIKEARINEYNSNSPIEYIVDGFDNPAKENELFRSLDEMLEVMKSQIKVVKPY